MGKWTKLIVKHYDWVEKKQSFYEATIPKFLAFADELFQDYIAVNSIDCWQYSNYRWYIKFVSEPFHTIATSVRHEDMPKLIRCLNGRYQAITDAYKEVVNPKYYIELPIDKTRN